MEVILAKIANCVAIFMVKHIFKTKLWSANVFKFTIWIMIPLTVDGQWSTAAVSNV
jgi:nitric oxide reductase large subunit